MVRQSPFSYNPAALAEATGDVVWYPLSLLGFEQSYIQASRLQTTPDVSPGNLKKLEKYSKNF